METLLGRQLYYRHCKMLEFKGWQYNCHPNIHENGSALLGYEDGKMSCSDGISGSHREACSLNSLGLDP